MTSKTFSTKHHLLQSLVLVFVFSFTTSSCMAAQPGSESHINEAIGKAYADYGVSEAVRAGDFLYIGGIVAFNDEGQVIAPGNGKKQM